MKRGIWLTVLVLVVGTGAAGLFWLMQSPPEPAAPPPPPTPITMLVWGSPADNPAMGVFQRACAAYSAAHPEVDLEIEFYSVEQYKSKLPVLMAANRPPDIFMTWSGAYLETFVDAGKVAPLNAHMASDSAWCAQFPPQTFDLMTYGESVYAIPTTRAVATLFYNTAIFERLGLAPFETQADMEAGIAAMRAAGITPFAFGNREPWVGGMLAGQIIQRIGGDDVLTDVRLGRRQWTDPALVQAGTYIQRLVQLGAFPENMNAIGYQESLDMFNNGEAAMLYMGSWYLQSLADAAPDQKASIGIMTFPTVSPSVGSPRSWMGQTDMNLAVSTACQDKDAAFAVIKWIVSEDYQKAMAKEAGLLPATRIETITDTASPELLQLIALQRDMEATFIFPDIGLGGRDGTNFNEAIHQIVAGEDPHDVFSKLPKVATDE